ncbi:MAG TPA: kelch repeat-containing protein [Candidatus Limnocylindrales bacterium]|nr:kelch repeat-containing protein [Candidatus Limnocylindrales bacterium]
MAENWTERPSLNVKRAGLATATIGERIYAIGGFGPGFASRDSVEVRDPDEVWQPVVPMLTARGNLGAAAVNDQIYVFGGETDHGSTKLAEVLTSANEPIPKWEPIAKLPNRLTAPGTAAFNGKIYLIGGSTGGNVTGKVHVYDPVPDKWSSEAAPMPTRRWFLRVTQVGGWLYAIGGANKGGQFLDTVERYNPENDIWEDVAPMGTPRGGPGVVTVNDRIYVVGGAGGVFGPDHVPLTSSEVFAEAPQPAWQPLEAVFPVGRSSLRAERAPGNQILAIGGFEPRPEPEPGSDPSNLVEALKILARIQPVPAGHGWIDCDRGESY